jgi:hypothetical protein
MQISPIPSSQNQVQQDPGNANSMNPRSIRLNVNRTPGYEPRPSAQIQDLPPAVTEPKAETTDTPKEPEATGPLSPQFAALAKQRRALQVKERELQEREKSLSSSGQGSIPLDRLKSEPLRVLLESGVTYEQLTEEILKNQGNPEINTLKAEINSLKEGVDKRFNEREQQAEQQVLNEMRQEASKLVAANDDFELIRETDSLSDVMKLIEQTYRKSGEVLDVKEACQLVEDELLKEAQKLAKLKKLQSQHAQIQQQLQPQRGFRTLTNRDTATPPMSAKQRALAAFRGELKR